eukprot:3855663-Rhodomonas_salina.1
MTTTLEISPNTGIRVRAQNKYPSETSEVHLSASIEELDASLRPSCAVEHRLLNSFELRRSD